MKKLFLFTLMLALLLSGCTSATASQAAPDTEESASRNPPDARAFQIGSVSTLEGTRATIQLGAKRPFLPPSEGATPPENLPTDLLPEGMEAPPQPPYVGEKMPEGTPPPYAKPKNQSEGLAGAEPNARPSDAPEFEAEELVLDLAKLGCYRETASGKESIPPDSISVSDFLRIETDDQQVPTAVVLLEQPSEGWQPGSVPSAFPTTRPES